MQLSIYVLLLAIGFVSASIGKVVDIVASSLLHVRALIPTLPGELWQIYLLWVGWSVALTMVAVLVTRKISTKAKGSGIPQMKSVLAGGNMSEEFLSVRCLVAKVLGLTAALSGGLSIGKEGPWVHFAAIVANLISKLDVFTHLNKSKLDWQKILSAGFAAGTAANFGAPVGGVLFSIEVTASHYLVRNYYPAFFCTWSAAFCFRLLNIRNKHGHGLPFTAFLRPRTAFHCLTPRFCCHQEASTTPPSSPTPGTSRTTGASCSHSLSWESRPGCSVRSSSTRTAGSCGGSKNGRRSASG